jgi:hypothetical protein
MGLLGTAILVIILGAQLLGERHWNQLPASAIRVAMKLILLTFALVAVSVIAADNPTEPTKITATELHTLPELASLAHSCDLIRTMNAGRWEEAKAMIKSKELFLPIIVNDAKSPEWSGIGAYRGTDRVAQGVRHRFGYGPGRNNPHELWLTYTMANDRFTFQDISVLGW